MGRVLTLIMILCFCPMVGIATEQLSAEDREKAAFYMKSGQDLYTLCSIAEVSPLHEKGVAFCYGFVSGAMSFYGTISKSPKMPKIICSDTIIPRELMVRTFLKWADANPQHLEDPPIDSLVRAAMANWPCPENNKEQQP